MLAYLPGMAFLLTMLPMLARAAGYEEMSKYWALGFVLVMLPAVVILNLMHFAFASCPWCGSYLGRYFAFQSRESCPKCSHPLSEPAFEAYLQQKGPHGTPPPSKPMSAREMLALPKRGPL